MYIIVLHYNLKIDVNDNRFEKKHPGRSGLIILLSNVVLVSLYSVMQISVNHYLIPRGAYNAPNIGLP